MIHVSLLAIACFYSLFFYFVISVHKESVTRTEHQVAEAADQNFIVSKA